MKNLYTPIYTQKPQKTMADIIEMLNKAKRSCPQSKKTKVLTPDAAQKLKDSTAQKLS